MYRRSTRVLSMILCISVLMALMSVFAFSAAALDASALSSIPSVQEAASSSSKEFKIESVEDLEFAGNNEALFDSADTIYLAKSINLIGNDSFKGFEGLAASFDGMGNMIYGWTAASRGLFYNCPMAAVRNLTLYKVQLDASGLGGAQWPALVFGMQQSALSTLQSTFTMENVHVKESKLIRYDGNDTGAAVLLSRYRVGSKVTVNIRNCSVVDTAIVGNVAKNNVAAIMGGVSFNVAADSVFNISDIMVKGFSHNMAANHCGILFGEMRRNMNISNVAVFDSELAAFGNENGDPCDASVIGRVFEGPISLNNVLLANNTLSSQEGSAFIMAMHDSASAVSVTYNGVYCADDYRAYEGADKAMIKKSLAAFESGEVAYLASTDSACWAMKDGMPAIGSKVDRVRKIQVSGAKELVLYANSGAELDLGEILPGMVFSANGGIMDENASVLSVPAADVALTAYAANSLEGKAVAALAYFAKRDASFYADGLEGALSNCEEKLSASALNASDVDALVAYKENYKSDLSAPDYPSVDDAKLYPGMKGYMIFDANDLKVAAELKDLGVDVTLYLANDLDLKNVEFDGFTGVSFAFDGMGHTIRNWSATTRGFFDWYGGKSISDLNFDSAEITWPTSDGVGLVVGRRYTAKAADFTMKNIHVSNSDVVNDGYVIDDGGAILLGGVSRPVNTADTAMFSFGAGRVISIENCSVANTAISGIARQRIAAAIGRVWGGFTYELEKVELQGFKNYADDPAGLLLGEVEGSEVEIVNSGIFASSGASSAIAAMGDGAIVSADRLLVAESGMLTVGVLYTNTYADVAGEGVTTFANAAFKSGEIAWMANGADKIWKVGVTYGYPSILGLDVPLKITFKNAEGEHAFYTNAEGVLLLSNEEKSTIEALLAAEDWSYGGDNAAFDRLDIAFDRDTVVYGSTLADREAAVVVDTLIEKIGKVSFESGEAIKAARDAYDLLTDAQKECVGLYDELLAAEDLFDRLGDVNGDGVISIADVVRILRFISGKITADALDSEAANVNGLGSVDTADAIAVCRLLLS